MVYPDDWSCPVCGSRVSGVKCPVCGYQPPAESGLLHPSSKPLPFKKRLIAFSIDLLIIALIGLIISIVISYSLSNSYTPFNRLLVIYSPTIIFLFLFLHPFYFFFFEYFFESTIGKDLMGLKLIISDNKFKCVLLRNASRFIEFIPLYIPSIISIKKSGVRFGDKISGSRVIFK